MNFFFGVKNNYLSCSITIPKFQNTGKINSNYIVYEAYVKNNKWEIKKTSTNENANFFFLKNDVIENDKIFFLASEDEIKKYNNNFSELLNLNKFTDTSPSAFRSNLRVYINEGGFSSYQSEYPFDMVTRNGSILSPVSTLLNKDADQNFIFLKNIFYLPKKEKGQLYFVDIVNKKILDTHLINSNTLNEIQVTNNFIKSNVFIFTENCLGIPLYISIKNKSISFEHTHPPHHYILSDNKFKIISNLKNEVSKIINKKNL